MNIERVNRVFKYFHLTLAVLVIALMVNYYFKLTDLKFNLTISIAAIMGALSIPITVWYKVKLTNDLEQNQSKIFRYKQSKIKWSTLLIGIFTIFIAKEVDSQIKILTLSIGIYLVVDQIVDFIAGKYFNTNILSFSKRSIVDLNGRIREINYKDIKNYEIDTNSITINEKYDKHKIEKKNFLNSESMIDEIENNYLKIKEEAK